MIDSARSSSARSPSVVGALRAREARSTAAAARAAGASIASRGPRRRAAAARAAAARAAEAAAEPPTRVAEPKVVHAADRAPVAATVARRRSPKDVPPPSTPSVATESTDAARVRRDDGVDVAAAARRRRCRSATRRTPARTGATADRGQARGAPPVAAYEVTKMPLPQGRCSGKYTDEAKAARSKARRARSHRRRAGPRARHPRRRRASTRPDRGGDRRAQGMPVLAGREGRHPCRSACAGSRSASCFRTRSSRSIGGRFALVRRCRRRARSNCTWQRPHTVAMVHHDRDERERRARSVPEGPAERAGTHAPHVPPAPRCRMDDGSRPANSPSTSATSREPRLSQDGPHRHDDRGPRRDAERRRTPDRRPSRSARREVTAIVHVLAARPLVRGPRPAAARARRRGDHRMHRRSARNLRSSRARSAGGRARGTSLPRSSRTPSRCSRRPSNRPPTASSSSIARARSSRSTALPVAVAARSRSWPHVGETGI